MSKWSIFALCIIAAVGLWFYNNGACPLQSMSPSSDTADEYAAGHIPGSLLIPFDEIKVKSDQLPQDKNTEIVVYCRSGRRSAIAADTLISLGYAKIYDLGAVSSWTYGLEK